MKATPTDDSWDWPVLYYVGTVILKMSPKQFWRCTPRKLNVLVKAHIKLNPVDGGKSKQQTVQKGFIDQVF